MDDIAYMPREAPARTADDTGIGFQETSVPGVADLALPLGTYLVDILNAQGNVIEQFAPAAQSSIDLRGMKPGTWTLRAHTEHGIRVRRFVIVGRGGTLWVRQPVVPARRR
ncbi:MAG: T9SS type A sorting domain-containing protein [Flavobacteriales bacterium]|nr:T9SS type A sorting domain-containing protein [Flavobacteriales bacterium]